MDIIEKIERIQKELGSQEPPFISAPISPPYELMTLSDISSHLASLEDRLAKSEESNRISFAWNLGLAIANVLLVAATLAVTVWTYIHK